MQMFADKPSCDCEDEYWKVKLYGEMMGDFKMECKICDKEFKVVFNTVIYFETDKSK